MPDRNEKSLERIISFSDAVFGFAITLLVLGLLEIPLPELDAHFFSAFVGHWQDLISFLVGFLTIFVCWLNHHHMFSHIVGYNTTLMWINGFLLLIITFTPLPTAVLAAFLDKENSIGVIFFGFTYFLIATFYYIIWAYAKNNGLLREGGDKRYYHCIKITYRIASVYTLITFAICFISNTVAIGMYLIMFLVFAFPQSFARRLEKVLF